MRIEEIIECIAEQEAAFPINDRGLGRLLMDTGEPGEDPTPFGPLTPAETARPQRILKAISEDIKTLATKS